jgi:glyoxylase-like metal-dependent hydrolase (beta-lactamase superfamily II)
MTTPIRVGAQLRRGDTSDGTLGYDTFVADPILMNVAGLLPNGESHMFSPLTSTLIYGERDAVLVDPPLTTDQAKALGDWIEASGKRLPHIFVTHGHGDHWFTANVLVERFGAQVVATAGTIQQMHNNVSVREFFWDKLWPGQIPPAPVTAITVPGNRFTLEGHDLFIVEVGHGDSDDNAVLHVPELGLVVAGDAIYNGVHQYLGESADGGRDAWRQAVDTVKSLQPRWVVASHKDKNRDDDAARVIAQTRQYLDDAEHQLAQNDTPEEFFFAMLERWPDRRLGATTLWAGTNALYASRGRDDSDLLDDSFNGWFMP